MTLWATQLTLLVPACVAFALLLSTYRRQDAMEEGFLCSLLLMAAGCVVPDALAFIPFLWVGFKNLWSDNLRVYCASACGILLVAFYAAIAWFFWHDSLAVTFVETNVYDAFSRTFFFTEGRPVLPLWQTVVIIVAIVAGLWLIVVHLSKYTRANVRVQARLTACVPFLLLSALSCLFPTRSGNCLFATLIAAPCYLFGLYVSAYGWPKLRLRRTPRRNLSSRRKLKRRTPYKMW